MREAVGTCGQVKGSIPKDDMGWIGALFKWVVCVVEQGVEGCDYMVRAARVGLIWCIHSILMAVRTRLRRSISLGCCVGSAAPWLSFLRCILNVPSSITFFGRAYQKLLFCMLCFSLLSLKQFNLLVFGFRPEADVLPQRSLTALKTASRLLKGCRAIHSCKSY